jgi:hypothetical protein
MVDVYVSTVRIRDERAIAPVVYRRAKVGQALAPEHHVVWSLFDRNENERRWLYRRLTDRDLRIISTNAPKSSPYAAVVTMRGTLGAGGIKSDAGPDQGGALGTRLCRQRHSQPARKELSPRPGR